LNASPDGNGTITEEPLFGSDRLLRLLLALHGDAVVPASMSTTTGPVVTEVTQMVMEVTTSASPAGTAGVTLEHAPLADSTTL
jgi:hypothetical protein